MTDIRIKTSENVSKIIKVGIPGVSVAGIYPVSATVTPIVNELIFTMNNGSTISAGYVDDQDEISAITNDGDRLIVTLENGVTITSSELPLSNSSTGITGGTPTFSDNGGLNLSIGNCQAVLYNNPYFIGNPVRYSIPATSFTLSDGLINYVGIEYNNGTPRYFNTTNVDLINESDVLPVNTILADDGLLHMAHWDNLGDGLSNKLHRRLVKTQRYARESGLSISSCGSTISIESGIVWRGGRPFNLDKTNSDGSNNSLWFFCHHEGSGWIEETPSNPYNNIYYDNGTLVTLSDNYYTINWIFRGVEDHQHGYYVLGDKEYVDIPTAKAETIIPEIPMEVSSHAILVGRIIVQKNSSFLTIEGAFENQFSGSIINNHNGLSGIQGGTASEYYHFSNNSYNILSSIGVSGTYSTYNGVTLSPLIYVNNSLISHNTSTQSHPTLSQTTIKGQYDNQESKLAGISPATVSLDYNAGNTHYIDRVTNNPASLIIDFGATWPTGAGVAAACSVKIKCGTNTSLSLPTGFPAVTLTASKTNSLVLESYYDVHAAATVYRAYIVESFS